MFNKMLDAIKEDVTRDLFKKAFAEWDRRYREDPTAFDTDMARIQRGQTTDDYGSTASAYFIEVLGDVAK
jgi:hypothetical protein